MADTSAAIHATSEAVAPLGNVPVLDKGSRPDAPKPRVASFKPEDLAALSPEARSQFGEALKKAGHDPAAVDAALSGQQAAKPVEVVDRREDPAAMSERETAALSAALDGVSDPAAVDLRGLFVGRSEDTATAFAVDQGLRTALSAMGMPAGLTRGFAEELLRGGDEWGALTTQAERSLYAATQRALVERVIGKPWPEVAAAAAKVTARIPAAAARELTQRGYFERGAVMVQLYRQAERMQSRGRP